MHNMLNPASRVASLLLLGGVFAASCVAQDTKLRPAESPRQISVFMIGDSTMADKPLIPAYPERGWGQLLPMYFKSEVRVENHAMNGRSTKSFIHEGRWDTVQKGLQAGDFVIIQFGHNDEKTNANRFAAPFGE